MADTDQMTEEEFVAWINRYRDQVTAIARRRLFPGSAQSEREEEKRTPEVVHEA